MRREDKIHNRESRDRLSQHKIWVEAERGWAGQHGQHPETEEEKNYRPTQPRPEGKDEASA